MKTNRSGYTTWETEVAADKFKTLASRALGLWRVVRLFREVGSRGIPGTREAVRHKLMRILDALDPATRAISEINQLGFGEKILGDTIDAAENAAKSAIDKTSIVLAHSILDDVVTECCELSAGLMPENWISFLEKRTVSLADVRSKSSGQISQEMLTEYIGQLSQQSLLKRSDILNQKYQPAPAYQFDLQPYKFDRDRLEQIDKHRQRIIHQLELSGTDENVIADDLRYLEATCFYFIFIVARTHGVMVDPLQDALDALGVAASNPLKLAYEELLLATSLPSDSERIWSFGGSVFAQDMNRRTRQLPILMPAGTPDLSSDRRRIVFVKYRRRGLDEPYSGHLVGREDSPVGDIWISGVDGSNMELVVRGGARPQLVPPVKGFQGELEGIQSPKFDPDGTHVYFIADAWVTSGAIYSLDLNTRAVTFFTDGNVYVVLHGEPHRGKLLVMKHRYYAPPNIGSFDHFWLVSSAGDVHEDYGEGLDDALRGLYGSNARKLAFPHLA
jgi:hypothetical protein